MKGKGRFKRSKREAVNRHNSRRLIKMIEEAILKDSDAISRDLVSVQNDERMRSAGNQQSRETGKVRPVKLKSRLKFQVTDKSRLKQLYGRHRNQTKLHEEVHKYQIKSQERDLSVLAGIESVVSNVRWRSGLVESRLIAENFIKQGHVQMRKLGNEKAVRVKYCSIKLPVGASLILDSKIYKNQREKLSHFKKESRLSSIPSYLDVDFDYGTVTFLHRPKDGEVLLPKDIDISLRSLKKL